MSLINRMLLDLEQRRTGQAAPTVLPEGVRVAGGSDKAPRRLGWALGALALAAVMALGLSQVRQPRPAAAADKAPPAADLRPSLQLARVLLAPAENSRAHPAEPAAVPVAQERSPAPAPAPIGTTNPPKATEQSLSEASAPAEATVKRVSPGQRAEFLYQKALGLLQQGRVAEAQGSLEGALVAQGGHAGARRMLAGLLVEAKRYGEAEQVLEEGLRLQVEEGGFAMTLARLRVERGDERGGLELLQKYLPQGENTAAYQAFLATLLQRQEQHRPAVEHFQAALRLAPNNAAWLVGLGISLQADNRPAEALDAFGRAKPAGGLSPELEAFVDQRLGQLRSRAQ